MEIDFLYYMKILATFTLTFLTYRLLVIEKKDKTKDHYSRPAWNFFMKKLYAQHVIAKQKKRQKKILKELRNYESDSPKILPNEDSSDSHKINGSDHEGNSLLVKFTRRRHRNAELWLILRIKNGQQYTTYTLPDHPNTRITNATPRLFEGSGLKLECLIPYSRWRLTYTGMLRKGISTGSDNNNNIEDDGNLLFVRLNFIWMTASAPSFWPFDWSTELMATALATEHWRDGKWMNLLNLKDAGGYGQFGACKGQVRIYENDYVAYKAGMLPKVETIELNLPGIRQRRWGPHKNEHLHRTAVILGTIKDGTVLEVGAFSSKIGVTHSQFGNVRAPNGEVLPINWTDFNLASIGEFQDQLPQATIIQITADDKDFIAVVTFRNHEKVPLFGGGGCVGERWDAFIIPVDIVCNTIRGYGFAVFWYPKRGSHFELFDEEFPSEIKRIFHRQDVPKADKQVLSFADKEAQSVSVSGGKGASLAILRVIQETKGEEFFDHRGRNFHVLNALVDQFSTSNKLLKSSHLFNTEPKSGRQRSGSITKALFYDPNDMEGASDFFVPQGFLISVSAFDEHLKKFSVINQAIKELEAIAYEKVVGDIETGCQRVQNAFLSTALSDVLKAEIAFKINQIAVLDENARFAVRSSGVTEDADELSSAGQNQTFLGLKSTEEVFDAVIKCWASLYSFQSVFYRRQNIQPVITSMAFVVQKMVAAQSAGVLFSRHFLNGDPSVIVITANYGLGESVVSAKSEPDTFLVKRHRNGEVEMLASIVGDKKFTIEMDKEESVKEIELDDETRKKLCLKEDAILKLARLSIVLEKFFGSPRDIEFAVTKDKRIYLLQSRSITALNNFTDFEIIHENDAAIMSPQDVLSKANVGEVFPGAISVLAQCIVTRTLQNQVDLQIFGKVPENLFFKYFPVTHHHICVDLCGLFLKDTKRTVGVVERVMMLSVCGNDMYELFPELIDIAVHRNFFYKGGNKKLRQLLMFGDSLLNASSELENIARVLTQMKSRLCDKNLLKHKTSSEVFNIIKEEQKTLDEFTKCHFCATNNSILYQAINFAILTHGAKSITVEHQSDITLILGSIGNIESANVPEMLKEIAKSILSSGKDKDFQEIDSINGAEWLQVNCPTAYELFEQFLHRHGHRALNEYDLSSKTWAMQPESVIDMIKSNLSVQEFTPKEKMTTEDILEQLKTPLSNRAKSFLKRIIPRHHRGVQMREEAKSKLVEAINEIRRVAIYLGLKMVNEGLLPSKDLIFHLSMHEIQTIIKTKNSRLINNAIRRQKVFPTLNELKFDEIMFGVPRPISENDQPDEILEGDILAKGMPVCNGKVTGRACVINNFSEIHKLQRGDILITYSTDIGWTPYFSLLSGICTEIGGLVSHGAVVARECNLPCIVGASRATQRIKHGDRITLIADEGVIVIAK